MNLSKGGDKLLKSTTVILMIIDITNETRVITTVAILVLMSTEM